MKAIKIAALLTASILFTWAIAVSENQAYACGLNYACPEGEAILYLHSPFDWIFLIGNYFSLG